MGEYADEAIDRELAQHEEWLAEMADRMRDGIHKLDLACYVDSCLCLPGEDCNLEGEDELTGNGRL